MPLTTEDIELIGRVKAHIEKHKHQTLAPFSIAGMRRLVELAESVEQPDHPPPLLYPGMKGYESG